MKKNIWLIILAIVVIGVAFTFGNKKEMTDAEKFKREYESVNNTTNEKGKEYRKLDIPSKNPMVYSSAEDIIERINNKESFAVYFGFKTCPWCRSVLPSIIEVANDLKIDTIYYVDVLDIRNTLEVSETGEVQETKAGTEGYYKLLEALDSVLDDYSLTNGASEEVDAQQKRIYAPNIISVLGGKPQDMTTGISDDQEDAYMKLTDKHKKTMYEKVKCVLECLAEDTEVCEHKNAC